MSVDNPTPAVEVAQAAPVVERYGPLSILPVSPTPEQREIVRASDLYKLGDARLAWVNEGDLSCLLLSTPSRGGEVEKLREARDALRQITNLTEAEVWQEPRFVLEMAQEALASLASPPPVDADTPAASEGAVPAGESFLAQLRRVNTDRYHAWVGDGQDAGILFDAAELGGEVGELLNVVKKLEREERGWRGSRAAPQDFADECADVLICLDKLARRRGVDLEAATVAKFNATSDKQGFPHMLAASPKPASDTAQAEIKRLRGLLIDPGTPPWEDARAVLVTELRKAGYSTHADNVEAAHGVLIPSDLALNLIAQASQAKPASDTGTRVEAGEGSITKALTLARDLLMTIEQTGNNLWWVNADDPETAVCDTMSAVEAAFASPPSKLAAVRAIREDLRACRSAADWAGRPLGHIDDMLVGFCHFYGEQPALAASPATATGGVRDHAGSVGEADPCRDLVLTIANLAGDELDAIASPELRDAARAALHPVDSRAQGGEK